MKYLFSYLSDFTSDEYKKAYENLSETARARVNRYKRDDDKKRSLLAQMLLSKLMSQNNIEATLKYEENGRPVFEQNEYFLSLSHSGEVAFSAVSTSPLGIDVEKIRPISKSLINRVCVDEEKAYVLCDFTVTDEKNIDDPDVLKRFFEIWTAKEAYFKMQGSGITDLKSVNTLELETESFHSGEYIFTIMKRNENLE